MNLSMARARSNLSTSAGVASPQGNNPRARVGTRSQSKPLQLAVSQGIADIEDSGPRFAEEEAACIKSRLLNWYDTHQRQLPWRQQRGAIDHELSPAVDSGNKEDLIQLQQQQAYATWVSEVMLQQTQVTVVVEYFNRWMEKWPTVKDLAAATEEEVNTLWAGLGYYRRARFLLEGAKQIVQLQGGSLPTSAEELQKIPGIGKYTAGAIASIAFSQPVPVVDGNVIRVLCRLKAISDNPKTSSTLKTLWSLAGQLVDAKRPGDLNQALMELGATICSRIPKCASCPIQENCKGFALSRKAEGSSNLVLVTDFPMKVPKASPRQDYVAVCVLERTVASATKTTRTENSQEDGSFLLVKRPQTGLLAGLWEFPSASLDGPKASLEVRKAAIDRYLKGLLGLQLGHGCHLLKERESVGTYMHVFSHIHMHMAIEWIHIHISEHDESLSTQSMELKGTQARWVPASGLCDVGLTSGVRKVYKMFLEFRGGSTSTGSKDKRKRH